MLFARLTRDELRRIVGLLLDETRERLRARGVELVVDETAADLLAGRGQRARAHRRRCGRTRSAERGPRRLTRILFAGDVQPGQRVRITAEGGELLLTLE